MNKEQSTLKIYDLAISNLVILKITILNEVFKNLEYCKHEGVFRAKINIALSLEQVEQLDKTLNEFINNPLNDHESNRVF